MTVTSGRRLLTALCVVLVSASTAASQPSASAERVAGWTRDLEFFMKELRSQHYVLRSKGIPPAMQRAAADFRRSLSQWSDERALAELMKIAALAGDGHTYVLPVGAERIRSRILPLRFYPLADGMFIIDAESDLRLFVGAELLSMAGVSSAELMRRITPYVARDNEHGVRWAGPFLLRFVGYIEAVTNKRFDQTVPVTLRPRGRGRDTTIMLTPIAPPRMRGLPKLVPSRLAAAPPPPLYLENVGRSYWMRPLSDSTLYVQFNQVANASDEPLAAFSTRLRSELARKNTAIVDVRHNNGGNAELLHPLVAVLKAFTARGGTLYVISGRNTFSAAQIFLSRAVHEAGARVVGEPSSSKPNFVGEENGVMLPWSGSIASISNRYHETIPGDRRAWIEPRPRIALSSAAYFANRDPVLETLLRR